MDIHTLQEFKHKLLTEKENLEKDLETFAKRDKTAHGGWDSKQPNFGDMRQDEGERADEVEEYDNEVSMEHSIEDRLTDIALALDKIEKNSYGQCDNCKKEISIDRLRVNPEARTCMSCNV